MKKHLLLFAIILFHINCNAQDDFEEGYFINNSDEVIQCQINYIFSKQSPTEFEYRLSENDEPQTGTIETAKEFGIYNSMKYIRRSVNIDRSSDKPHQLSDVKAPVFKEEVLFLKVLLEGRSDLYEYADRYTKRYFYSVDSLHTEQLIYKRYKVEGNTIDVNNAYKQQLWNDLKCPTVDMRKINDVEYTKTDLMKFFTEYSKCHDDEFTDFEKKEKKKGKREKNLFNLTLRPRLDNSSLTIESFSYIDNFKFANNTSLGFGVETEFILAFTNRRVSLLVEPTYQHFKGEKVIYHKLLRQFFTATIDYHSIMVPVGIRYYFPVGIKSTLFADANFLIADLSPKTFIDFTLQDAVEDAEELDSFSSEIAPKSLFSIGVGYKYYNKYSVEIRYQKSEIFLYNFFEPDYKTLSVILGYTLFR